MTTALTVVPYTPAAREQWDATVQQARARHFMFERSYMDYHADRFEDASWLVLAGDRPIAVYPASRHGSDVVSHGGLSFGGLLGTPELTATRTSDALAALAEQLRGEGVARLVHKPVPHIYHRQPAEEELYALHMHGARLVRRDVSAAIAPGSEVAMASERRRALRRAQAANVIVAQSGQIDAFFGMLAEMLHERHQTAPVHTAAEMRRLIDRFPEQIRLFAAEAEGELVGGVIVYQTPAVAHAQYIAASDRGREIGATDATFAHLIAERYPDRWFDFGISNERDGSLNRGLMRNKEGFGARAVVYDRYVLDLG